jgi:sigma-B regulation protein RsbU (phosphoserine phosphatase)
MKSAGLSSLRKIYALYSSGLTYQDIKRLIKHDLVWTYGFYVNRMKRPEAVRKGFFGKILFIRNLFIEFLLQLTPVRRLLYSAALFIFIWAYLNGLWGWALIAVILFNVLIAFELADKLTAKDELEVAREIQFSLMPKEAPPHPAYKISFYCEPASEVGGDYFDFLKNNDQTSSLRIIIGDISGKGMAAALHMVQVKSIVRLLGDNIISPKENLTTLNKNLSGIFRDGLFFTTTFLQINNDHSVSVCRAGHQPTIYYCRATETCSLLTPKGIGIGLTDINTFNNNLEQLELGMSKGDMLILYTDGLTETMNESGMFFSEARLLEIVNGNAYKSADQVKDCIIEAVREFMGYKPVKDDLTLIVLKHI